MTHNNQFQVTMNFTKNDIVRLLTGETCRILNLPGTFMSNGSYEVVEVQSTMEGKFLDIEDVNKKKKRMWVKPKQIAYSISQGNGNTLSDYFEIVHDDEIQIIPKELIDVELVEENGFKTIKLIYENKTVNILIGEFNPIKNENK